MLNVSTLNAEIVNKMARAQAAYDRSAMDSTDRDMIAQAIRNSAATRITTTDVAIAYTNSKIAAAPDITGFGEVTALQDNGVGGKIARAYDFDSALWLIAMQDTAQNGFMTSKALNTAIQNWITEDAVDVIQVIDFDSVTNDTLAAMVAADIVKPAQMVEGTDEKGEVTQFYAHVMTDRELTTRDELFDTLAGKARPKMAPLKIPAFDYDSEGNSEIGVSLFKDGTAPCATTIESVRRLGSVPFSVSPEMADIIEQEAWDLNYSVEEQIEFTLVSENTDVRYFQITADWRNRKYYRGGMTTPQGSDACKAAYQFHNAVELGDEGLMGMLLHMSAVCGVN